MPMYTFRCGECGAESEELLSVSDRDTTEVMCPECGEAMTRAVDVPVIGKPEFQMNAILESGRHVPGHFGKTAKRERKK